MALRIVCMCGYVIQGDDGDELVKNTRRHMAVLHPELVGNVNAGMAAGGGGMVVVVVGPATGIFVVVDSPGVGIDGPPTGRVVVVVLGVGGAVVVVVAPYATPGAATEARTTATTATRIRVSPNISYPIGIHASHLQQAPGPPGAENARLGRSVSSGEPGSRANPYRAAARPAIPIPVLRECFS